jgi:GxxExxY protein
LGISRCQQLAQIIHFPSAYRGYYLQTDAPLVENRGILALKNVASLGPAHYAQVRSYLKATQLDLALLINCSTERADFSRVAR